MTSLGENLLHALFNMISTIFNLHFKALYIELQFWGREMHNTPYSPFKNQSDTILRNIQYNFNVDQFKNFCLTYIFLVFS